VKDRLPIIVVAVALVLVVAIAVRVRMKLSVPPVPTGPSQQLAQDGGPKGDYSERVANRLRLLRAEHARRLQGEDDDEPGGSPPGANPSGGRPAQRAAKGEQPGGEQSERRRGALDFPVPNADVGRNMAELTRTLTGSPSREKRAEAARDIGASGEPDATKVLVDAMGDRDPEVRAAVVEALQDYVEDLTPDVLKPVLKDPDANVRFEVVTLIGLMEGPDAMAAAGEFTQDPDPDVRDLADEVQDVLANQPTPLPEVTPPHWYPVGRKH
jgi:hypothetical protein